MMTRHLHPTEAELAQMSEADLDAYADTFTGEPEPFRLKAGRSSSISVRFSPDELELVQAQADAEGVKVTAFIRSAALAGSSVGALRGLRRQLEEVTSVLGRMAG